MGEKIKGMQELSGATLFGYIGKLKDYTVPFGRRRLMIASQRRWRALGTRRRRFEDDSWHTFALVLLDTLQRFTTVAFGMVFFSDGAKGSRHIVKAWRSMEDLHSRMLWVSETAGPSKLVKIVQRAKDTSV